MTSTASSSINEIRTHGPTSGMVVGVDGSGSSLHALQWAARRTDRFGPIQPVIAWHYPWWAYIGPPIPVADPFESEARARIEQAVASVRSSDMAEPIVVRARATSSLVDIGATAGLIVVGAHGRSGLTDGFVGSVASGVVARSPVPVAVVPPSAPLDDHHRRVVVGIDGSPNSIRAMQWAAANVPVTCVIEAIHSWTPEPKPAGLSSDHYEAAHTARARRVLDQSLSHAAQAGPVEPPVRAHLVQGDPRSVLRDWSAKCDLLVLGARGRGAVADLLVGSVTTALIQRPRATTVVIPAEV